MLINLATSVKYGVGFNVYNNYGFNSLAGWILVRKIIPFLSPFPR
jgi:hypothetical protein